ncbi:MAG TPA: transporter substrate-binding domain-containing protein [Spirochaetota bacterium]|nr:transporter substrate-binding domain-containing protein [Spirochaetota bacterium]HPJ44121.1 transporter substrate-binding domain-containing protein [Spirochaetota bacterium]
MVRLKKWYNIFIILSLSIITALLVYILYGDGKSGKVQLTQEEREWLDTYDGRIRIGADFDYVPMDFINQWNEHDGIAEDYFRLIERKLNIRFKRLNTESWKELLETAKKGDIEIIKCIVKTPERSEYLQFTQPYLEIPAVIVSRNDVKSDSLTLKDLAGKKTAVNDGYFMNEIIRNRYPGISIIPVKSNAELFEVISTGSVDFIISDMPSISYFVKKNGIANLKIAGYTGEMYKLAIAAGKDLAILNSILSKTVDSITEEEKESIESKWISVEYRRYLYSKGLFIAILAGITIVITIALIIGIWNKSLQLLVQKKTAELEKYKNSLEELVEERTKQLREANRELANALANVKTLTGLLPICSNCKKIRNDGGYWEQIELYISEHTNADFSHGLCPDCAEKLYPEYHKKK